MLENVLIAYRLLTAFFRLNLTEGWKTEGSPDSTWITGIPGFPGIDELSWYTVTTQTQSISIMFWLDVFSNTNYCKSKDSMFVGGISRAQKWNKLLRQWFIKCSPQTSSGSITWGLVRNEKFQFPFQIYKIKNSEVGVQQSVFLADCQIILMHCKEPPLYNEGKWSLKQVKLM